MWNASGIYDKEYLKLKPYVDTNGEICFNCGYPYGFHYGYNCPIENAVYYPLVAIEGYLPKKYIFKLNLKII